MKGECNVCQLVWSQLTKSNLDAATLSRTASDLAYRWKCRMTWVSLMLEHPVAAAQTLGQHNTMQHNKTQHSAAVGAAEGLD